VPAGAQAGKEPLRLSGEPLGSLTAARALAATLTAVWLLTAALLLEDYGPTWDCVQGEYAHGEQYLAYLTTGDARYLDFSETGLRPLQREPHLAYPRYLFTWYETHPFAALLSAASCRVLWTRLGWLDALRAHHLVVVVMAALLLCVLVHYATRRFGAVAGLGTAVGLLLSPSVFAQAFNNLNDLPECCLYALAVLCFAWALDARGGRRTRLFLLCGMLTGFALAQKANALFIPVQCGLYWALSSLVRRARGLPAAAFPWRGVALAGPAFAAAYLLVHPQLWSDVTGGLLTYLRFIAWVGTAGVPHDQLDGLKSVLTMTPPALLLAAGVGACSPRLTTDERLLLLLGVALPVGRTLVPGARNFDGFRHFLEFQPFLALLAGVGLLTLVDATSAMALRRRSRSGRMAAHATGAVLVLAFVASPLRAVVATHPHGVCYHNVFVGGLQGARSGAGIHAPGDYWAGSYWQGLAWLSEHAEPGATVFVPVAPFVAQAAAPLRLRPDLRLGVPAQGPVPGPLYVMYITRPLFYDEPTRRLEAQDPPLHSITVQGASILAIHRLTDPALIAELVELWRTGGPHASARRRLRQWIATQPPDVVADLRDAFAHPDAGRREAALEQLRAVLPADLREDVALLVRDGVYLDAR
jgi:hypothetical protein